ncbi:HAD family hydrolase [Streptomyces albidoflavus]|uniref:HAD family hydrolase n=1 Tax=Streptomyces albidoflavus TaxID=1886 RepID=UPI00386AA6C5|nr:HAD family hydrolase [Streptomyces albidoflavus]
MTTPAPEQARAAIIDVDGTLVDSTYFHTVAWWEAFRQAGHKVATRDIHRLIGMSGGHLVERLIGPGHSEEHVSAISDAHATLFGTWHDRLQPVPGAADLLRALARRGWRVVLATSARGHDLKAMLGTIDADDAILATTDSDQVDAGKPAPDLVEAALREARVPPNRAHFVGDSVWDVVSAGRAGVDCTALLSGGVSAAELKEAGAVAVYDTPGDLLAHLDTSPLAA